MPSPRTMTDPEARKHALALCEEALTDFLLRCPAEQNWEDFDPEIDNLRTQVQDLQA